MLNELLFLKRIFIEFRILTKFKDNIKFPGKAFIFMER